MVFNFNESSSVSSMNEDDIEVTQESQDLLFQGAIIEAYNRMDDEQKEAFLESAEVQALVEAGKMRKNTIVFLSKNDDMTRRSTLAAIVLAKQSNDNLWKMLVKNKQQKRIIIGKILKKYGNKGQKVAKKQQKDWIKNKMPKNFGKFGGADRISR